MVNAFIKTEDGRRKFIATKNGVFYLNEDPIKAQNFQDEEAAHRAAYLLDDTRVAVLEFQTVKTNS